MRRRSPLTTHLRSHESWVWPRARRARSPAVRAWRSRANSVCRMVRGWRRLVGLVDRTEKLRLWYMGFKLWKFCLPSCSEQGRDNKRNKEGRRRRNIASCPHLARSMLSRSQNRARFNERCPTVSLWRTSYLWSRWYHVLRRFRVCPGNHPVSHAIHIDRLHRKSILNLHRASIVTFAACISYVE